MNDNQAGHDPASAADQQAITAALEVINGRRAVIEQAKGMLMFVHGIDADEAFGVLRSQSQTHNVKLSLVAEQIVKDLIELSRTTRRPDSADGGFGLIATAHERVAHGAERQLDGESKTGVPMKDLIG